MNKKKLIIGIVSIVLLFAIILTVCLIVYGNTTKAQLIGKFYNISVNSSINLKLNLLILINVLLV